MNKLLLIIGLIILISCKAKQIVIIDAKPDIRPQYETRKPNISDKEIVDLFFKTWFSKSIPISTIDFNQLDTLTKFGYQIFEELISDTSFIGINPRYIKSKYILIPNTFFIGFADNYNKKYDMVFYDSIKSVSINDFRPRIYFDNKQILYYTREYQDTLPKFSEKYGVGGYIILNSYLMSNRLRYFETPPVISGVIKIRNTDEYCISYRYGSRSYETLAKKENNKWIRIKDLTILESD